jgi:DNA-binding MarR family transcriptional regulator
MTVTKTDAAKKLTELVLLIFRANGRILEAAEEIAAPAGLTAARWQVLGATLETPKSVADIARDMGLARQSVQRLADILVDEKLAQFTENPAHRRAKLFSPTGLGFKAIGKLADRQSQWANQISGSLTSSELGKCFETLETLVKRLEK